MSHLNNGDNNAKSSSEIIDDENALKKEFIQMQRNAFNTLHESLPKSTYSLICCSGVLAISLIFLILFWNLWKLETFIGNSVSTPIQVGAIVSGIIFLGAMSILIILIVKRFEITQKQLVISFYGECLNNEIYDLKQTSSLAKARLIAKKAGLYCSTDADVQIVYEKAQQLIGDFNVELQKIRLIKKRESEELQRAYSQRFVDYYGSSKQIAMLNERLQYVLSRIQDAQDDAHALYTLSQQKELDWATRGGIAAGLSGGAAGLAVAIETQNKNTEIREQNKVNLDAIAPLLNKSHGRANTWKNEADEIRIAIKAAELKLVADISNDELFSKLDISGIELKITETGAVEIHCRVTKPNDLFIYDNVPAVIDGAINAILMDNGSVVDTVPLVFPAFGVDITGCTLTGICFRYLSYDTTNSNYTVKFSPYKLWAIEK